MSDNCSDKSNYTGRRSFPAYLNEGSNDNIILIIPQTMHAACDPEKVLTKTMDENTLRISNSGEFQLKVSMM
jgi:hypothetical protein